MIRKLFLFLTAVLSAQICFAQDSFLKVFKNNELAFYHYNTSSNFFRTLDGGFMLIANFSPNNPANNDMGILMIKLDSAGNVQWTKPFNTTLENEFVTGALQTPQGDYLLGSTYSLINYNYEEEYNLLRYDAAGNLLMDTLITSSGGSCCWAIATGKITPSLDGNYFIFHKSFSISSGHTDYMKVTSSGNILSQQSIMTYGEIKDALETQSNGIILMGHNTGGGINSAFVQKRSAAGAYISQNVFFIPGSTQTNYINSAVELTDGFLFPVNYYTSTVNGTLLVKTNFNLDTVWTKTYTDFGNITGIDKLPGGNIVLAGSTGTSTDMDVQIVVMDQSGNILYKRRAGTPKADLPRSFVKDTDGTYLLSGTSGPQFSDRDVFIMKFDANFCIAPKADFTKDASVTFTAGQAGLAVKDMSEYTLRDTSLYSWQWDFGDGFIATTRSASHVYATQGTHTVKLIVNNGCSTDTISKQYFVMCAGEEPGFAAQDSLLGVNFNYGSGTAWSWDFGDGNFSALQAPSHVYSSPGSYNVCLTSTNACGTVTICDSITVSCTAPVVNLGTDVIKCISSSPVVLNAGPGSSYHWSTGENTGQVSVSASGTYAVKVTNSCNASGYDTIQVTLSAAPVIDIGRDTSVCMGTTLIHQNLSGHSGYTYQWYRNDTLAATSPSYSYQYSKWGINEITVIANNQGCPDTATIAVAAQTLMVCSPTPPSYCTPSYTLGTSGGNYIDRVILKTLDNNNSGAAGGPSYTNYYNTSMTVPSLKLEHYMTFYFTLINTRTMYGAMWIDYNQNGIFEASERTGGSPAYNSMTLAFAFMVPKGTPGGYTRMRVRYASSSSELTMDPCANYTYGETEDYKVFIEYPCTAMSITGTVTDASCSANTGSITTDVTGGSSPYTYVWSNGSKASSPNSLAGGTYTLTLRDFYGCTSTDTFTVQQPAPNFTASASAGSTCNNACTGQATAVTQGPLQPYTYLWDAQAGNQTTATAQGLCSGTYTVIVTNADNCALSAAVTVGQQPAMIMSIDTTYEVNQQCDGTAAISITGGTPPYQYAWSHGLADTSAQGSLCAGSYTVAVTDANGCTVTDTVEISNVVISGVEAEAIPSISIYPNPAYDNLIIELDASSCIAEISIVDVMGKEVKRFASSEDCRRVLDISDLSQGLYWIEITSGKKVLGIQRVIKM